jgi:hypothetical protein
MFRSTNFHAPTRRHLAIAGAVIAAILLALAVSIDPAGRTGGNDSLSSTAKHSAGAGAESGGLAFRADELVEPEGDVGASANRKAAPEPTDFAAGISADESASTIAAPELDARIIRTATIDLKVKRKGFEDAWSDAQAVATSSGGYIIGASRSGAGDSSRIGTITMRVPTGRFETAVERLRDVSGAKVAALDVASQDVTQEFVDVKSRLKHDRAVEGRLLTLIADADGVSEVLAVQARLDSVQEQIEVARGRLQYLEKLTAMSTIEAKITAPPAGVKVDESRDDPSVLGEAWGDAVQRFSENVASAVVWLGGALPALILLSILAIVGRVVWRRHDRTKPSTPPESAA